MRKNNKLLRLMVMSVLIALGVVISPILRFEGMCPMAHLINIVCSVLLGPLESLVCAILIGIIRMIFMGIPPIALTGAVFGAFLSGILYRMSKGRILFAVLGEIAGTGIIGAVASYPVMTFLWGKEGLSWLFYIPSFICGTLIGGSIAFVFLKKLSATGLLTRFQDMLGSPVYQDKGGILSNSLTVMSFGVICFIVIKTLTGIFSMSGTLWDIISYSLLGGFIAAGIIYLIIKKLKRGNVNDRCNKQNKA